MTKQSLGVCYYPEHWPEERWETDAGMMREAGITFVRIGEFAWSRLEPNPGEYDFGWLERAIDTLHEKGLKVVLGTPTATPPKWLVDRMPDMVALDADGRPRGFGSRRHYCFSHVAYALECDRIVTELATRFGKHPGITAWQTDNEYGCHDTVVSYSTAARDAFRIWLKEKYQTISRLNDAWGNVFWSMEYRDFSEIELPNLTVTEANPAHRLDFRRFSSDQVIRFNRRQVEIIREFSPGRDILHNFMGSVTDFDHYRLSQDLDAASWDSYPLGFLERDGDDEAHKLKYMRVGDPDMQAFHHDLYRACGRGRWWVMEQQPGPVNWAPWNPAPLAGAQRLWAYEAFAAGAEVVSYFRWRQAPFAQEQYHEALLLPDGSPNAAYETCRTVSAELAKFDASVGNARADVALVFDYESDWAWQIQPQGADFSYLKLVLAFYRALRKAGLTIDVVPPTADAVRDRKLIILPGLMCPNRKFIDELANTQAMVLAGPRTGAKTQDFRIPADLPPGGFREVIDFDVWRVESLRPGAQVRLKYREAGLFLERWREFLRPGEDATAIIESEDGHPALLASDKRAYLAGWPNEDLLDETVAYCLAQAGIERLVLPDGIRIRDHGPHRFIFNHLEDEQGISAFIGDGEILLGGETIPGAGVAVVERRGR
ncbi:beta-galactosidase [Rhizobiales bacterium]|uniref:beta-galactosidase n=1 Tax=Hongsoonwoonella zoysiae TaxID=2821844 RepID=UPI00156074EB|nr:beta-galactosidase [Hongsoonwoonella zoysiae]NRG16618.1 beta-galactosidase [Hongsoonwoonella zoysiae]